MTPHNEILLISFNKEMEKAKSEYQTKIHNIFMDNIYISAIDNAVDKVNKATKKSFKVGDWLSNTVIMGELLTPTDELMIQKITEDHQKEVASIKEKYTIAKTLLNMADSFEEKITILRSYCKDMPL